METAGGNIRPREGATGGEAWRRRNKGRLNLLPPFRLHVFICRNSCRQHAGLAGLTFLKSQMFQNELSADSCLCCTIQMLNQPCFFLYANEADNETDNVRAALTPQPAS